MVRSALARRRRHSRDDIACFAPLDRAELRLKRLLTLEEIGAHIAASLGRKVSPRSDVMERSRGATR
jgi:hypothetical protein